MRWRVLVSAGFAMLLLVMPGVISHATPSPPSILLNEATGECWIGIMSDECTWCDPPDGWRVLAPGSPGWDYNRLECPTGFTRVNDRPALKCSGYKTQFCCGGFSTHGDCNDMVINPTQQACAFVEDVDACILPQGWSRRPANVPEGSWTCTYGWDHWVDPLSCLTATVTPQAIRPVASQPPPRADTVPAATIGLIALGGSMIAFGGGMIVWLLGRRRS